MAFYFAPTALLCLLLVAAHAGVMWKVSGFFLCSARPSGFFIDAIKLRVCHDLFVKAVKMPVLHSQQNESGARTTNNRCNISIR